MTASKTVTREQFEKAICQSSGKTIEEYRLAGYATLPCDCDFDQCQGWAVVRPSGLFHHLRFCLPAREKLEAMDYAEDEAAVSGSPPIYEGRSDDS